MPYDTEKKITPLKKDMKGDLPETKEQWVRYVNDFHDKGLTVRRKHEFTWILNIAYYLGYQHLIFNTRTGSVEIPKTLQRPLTINRIGSFIEARLAKLTKNRPVPIPIPDTTDKEDINGAKYAGHALMHLWRQIEMEEEYEILTMLGLLTGTSFFKTVWNPFGGDFVSQIKGNSKTGMIEVDGDGESEEKIWLGDVSSKAIPSFAIIPGNEGVYKIRDQTAIMERQWFSWSEINTYYPHITEEVLRNSHDDKTEYEKIIDRLSSPASTSIGSAMSRMRDSLNQDALAKILWIKPNAQYKRGVVVSVIGNELAYIDEFPHDYGYNIYPFTQWRAKTDGLHFWGQSDIERLMPIQRAYNRLKQKKLNNAYLMGNGKWLLAKGSQVSEQSLTDVEGEVVEYNSTVPAPQQAAIAPLPNYIIQLAQELIVDFRDAGGQREMSATPGSNLTASVAMQTQAELSDEHINPMIRRLGRCMERTANIQLILMNEEYTDPRKIKIFGDSGVVGVQWMSNVDFRHATDVHIDIESLFPEFRGAKRQMIFDLWDRRILTDPKQVLQYFRYGNYESILEDIEKEEDPVWLDIAQIKKGREPEVSEFQNHMAYFTVLSKWIQTPEFLRLIPERKQLAIQVLQAHMQFLQQSLPNGGQPLPQTNQAATGAGPLGPTRPVGA